MSRLHTLRPAAAALVAAGLLALTACATPAGSDGPDVVGPVGPGSDVPVILAPLPPTGEVVGQGTVMDVAGEVELCLGAIAESYPPQCWGIPLDGWSWDVEGSESSGDVTWGSYAVQGTYDGWSFTLTQPPILLALHDPPAFPDPTGGVPGTTDEDALAEIQDRVPDLFGDHYLMSSPDRGYLWVQVVWDDGTFQRAADEEFGADVVVVQSALREVG